MPNWSRSLSLFTFPVVLTAAPTISRISPTLGRPGDIVTITGSGFSTEAAKIDVRFGPNRAPVLAATPTTLTVQIPNGQPYAPTQVTVDDGTSNAALASNGLVFNVASNYKEDNQNLCWCCYAGVYGWFAQEFCGFLGLAGGLSMARGEFFEDKTDLRIPGRPSADEMVQYSFRRYYRNQITKDGPMGQNWDHNYFERLEIDIDGGVIHSNGLGRTDKYLKNNRGDFVAPPQFHTKLIKNPNDTFLLRYANGTTKKFAADGKILEIRDRNQNLLVFFYNAQQQLIRVNDTLGRDIIYRYVSSGANVGRLMEIEDFIGRKVTFTHDSNGDLVAVTGPAVTGTPNGNDFPFGKTIRYSYSSGYADVKLNHNLLTETRPNEVANGGPAVLINVYGTDPNSFSFDKVIRITYGGTNASGVAAGGQFTFVYTKLNAGVVSDDPNLVVSRTQQTDRNANVKEYDFVRLGYVAEKREYTRGLRAGDPPVYVTTMRYNADGKLVQRKLPAQNVGTYRYDDGNSDRLGQGNLLNETHTPDARGGDQTALVTTYTYEPRFNQIKTITDPRGNDPSFVPANGGPNSAARYTTTFTYDYEVGGLSTGNVVRKQQPTVTLPDSTLQAIITDYTYNAFGQLTSETDPEGNVTQYFYYPENDPDGDGNTSRSTRPGPDTTTGGYLKQKIEDAITSPRRTEAAPLAAITTQYLYDPVGNVIRLLDGRGTDKLFTINALNQVVRSRSEATYRYVQDTFYDANDNVVRTDTENRIASSADGKPIYSADGNFNTAPGSPASFQDRFTYDILDMQVQKDLDATSSTPPRLVTRFRYDSNQNRTQEILPEGNIHANAYDERDLRFRVIRGLGSPQASTSIYSYDPNRNLVSMAGAEDKNGDGRNDETLYQYDGYDRWIAMIDAVGGRAVTHYDPNGAAISQSIFGTAGGPSPLNNSGSGNTQLKHRDIRRDELDREFQYDDRLFVPSGVITIRPPSLTEGALTPGDGKVSTRFFYDRNSRIVKEIQDDLDTTRKEYDGMNRQVGLIDPQGNTTAMAYDANSNLIRIVETDVSQKSGVANEAFTTTYQYDSMNRRTAVTDNCGNTTRYAYDSRGNMTHSTDAKADATVGCPASVNDQGNSRRYSYDGANRRLQSVVDLRTGGVGSGSIDTTNSFNADGRIITAATYDGNSRLRSRADDKGNLTQYTYDALDRRTAETLPDGSATTYTYDRNDNVIAQKDNNGTTSTYTYDALNRRVNGAISRAAGVIGTTAITYQYDGLSRFTRTTDNNNPANETDDSTVLQAYDSLSRVIEESQNGRAIDSAWTGRERRSLLTYPNGRTLMYSYDSLDRLQTINDSGPMTSIAKYTYIGPERVLERLYQNNVRLTYLNDAGTAAVGYDGIRRTVAMRHLRPDNSLVAGFTYVYDRESNKSSEDKLHVASNSEVYEYDSVYRIVNFARGQLDASKTGILGVPLATESWTLDGVNSFRVDTRNGSPQARTVNNLNQYTVVDSINQTYDKNGNLVHDGSFGYRWDYRNRLRQVCTLDLAQRSGIDGVPGTADDCSSAGARVISVYTYDALDRRIRKSVTSSGPLNGATNFYYDRWRTIEERDSADVLLRQAVYGVYTDELLALDTNQDGNNTAIGAADRRLFYHQNGIGSIAALSDATRTVVEGYQYAAYGNQIVYGPVFGSILSTAGSVANPYRFTGQRFDPETGLFYFRKRQLSPWLGDFISRDPGGIWHDDINVGNAYAYVGDAPTKLTDWDGKGGFTNCNRMKGEMVTVNNTQGCPRICTEEHEEVHRNDGAVCCLKYSEKYKAAPDITAKNALTNKWNEWINSQEDWAECRGYTKSVDCADRKLKENKCAECPADKPEGTAEEQDKWRVQRKCCDELNKYKEEAEKLKKKHCDDNKGGKATQPACPF